METGVCVKIETEKEVGVKGNLEGRLEDGMLSREGGFVDGNEMQDVQTAQ